MARKKVIYSYFLLMIHSVYLTYRSDDFEKSVSTTVCHVPSISVFRDDYFRRAAALSLGAKSTYGRVGRNMQPYIPTCLNVEEDQLFGWSFFASHGIQYVPKIDLTVLINRLVGSKIRSF